MTIDVKKATELEAELDKGEDFLTRWSRRKHNAQQQQTDPQSRVALSATSIDQESLPSDADMPPLESLTEESDYSGFLSPRVSEALRQQALRKLFHTVGFNVCDGLDDYDEDFTSFEKLGDIITADMKHQMEMEAQRLKQLAEDEVFDDLPQETDNEQISTETTVQIQQVSDSELDAELTENVVANGEEERT